MLQLLEELKDPHYWADGCCRVILYCIRNNDLRSVDAKELHSPDQAHRNFALMTIFLFPCYRPAVDLLKKLSDNFRDDDLAREVIFDEVSPPSSPILLKIECLALWTVDTSVGNEFLTVYINPRVS